MKKSVLFALGGLFIGAGAPVGALLLKLLGKPPSLSPLSCMMDEWTQYPFFYGYMLVSTSMVFALVGYLVGRYEDTIEVQNQRLTLQATHDPLTGLENHRRMHEIFNTEFKKHLDLNRPISCLMMDLDNFKKVNDTHGHPFGDEVLRHFAAIFLQCVRQGDVATRYGGEEFLCILPDCGEEDAKLVADRIRLETEKHCFEKNGSCVPITISVGAVTAYGVMQTNYRALIDMADHNLYKAKKEGRNRVVQSVSGKSSAPASAPVSRNKPEGGDEEKGV